MNVSNADIKNFGNLVNEFAVSIAKSLKLENGLSTTIAQIVGLFF